MLRSAKEIAVTLPMALLMLAGTSLAQGNSQQRDRIAHALDRFTFGATSKDIDQVSRMGLDRWFESQLHPDSINDSSLDRRLTAFRTLTLSPSQVAMEFPSPQVLRAVSTGKLGMPSDAGSRAVYQSALQKYEKKLAEKKAEAGGANPSNTADSDDPQEDQARLPEGAVQDLLSRNPNDRFTMLLRMGDLERKKLLRQLTPEEREIVFRDFTPKQREDVLALVFNPQAVVTTELLQAKLLRETYSERQLQEVMTDFWFNHFNVFINKGQERYMVASYERDAIRPHALGKFKDLLLATAHSPAMLFYLDNAESVGPDSDFVKRPRRGRFFAPDADKAKKRLSGINENYARELMELHTLGVDGGYTQQDVANLAKILTGWTITPPRTGEVRFEYRPEFHEPGDKVLLGVKIKSAGEKEGLEALDLLSKQPATARFVSKKLAMRFVSDDPPQALVDRMANTFLRTDGDIKEVLRTMYKSPEFWDASTYRVKAKTPLEFVVSSLRATGAEVTNAQPLAQALNRMGMPLYGMQPPTGYSMKEDAWINSAALLARFNFALALAANRIPGTKVDARSMVSGQNDLVPRLEAAILNGQVSSKTHDAILRELDNPALPQQVANAGTDALSAADNNSAEDGDPFAAMQGLKGKRQNARFSPKMATPTREALATGLILGSPEFQKR